jgi:hypothetical protein
VAAAGETLGVRARELAVVDLEDDVAAAALEGVLVEATPLT